MDDAQPAGAAGDPRHLLDVDDLSVGELEAVLDRSAELKARGYAGRAGGPLARRTLGMVFEKPSTRTRVGFEAGMTQLGGHAVFLGPDDIGLGEREPLRDTSRALSRYVDAIMIRMGDHAALEAFAGYAGVPVINGLTDDAHPCQTLADLLTIREHLGFDARAAWVGDGNNVAQSFVVGAAMVGLDLTVATPEGYGVDESVLERARSFGGEPALTHDPREAVADADVVYTDVWVSMGQEAAREEKLAAFEAGGFRLDDDLLGPDLPVMHCLPAHRGEEITDDVIESDRALVWDQAENRLHAHKGLLCHLLE